MLDTLIKKDVPLAPLTSWLVGGSAEFLAMPTTSEEVLSCVQWASRQQLELTILGGGSNVLISDQGVRGLVLCLRKFSGLQVEERENRLRLTALAGTGKSELLKTFLKYKLAPALFLAGLPGDVGGGVAMNAGVGEAMVPREFVELVDWIEVLEPSTANVRRFQKNELHWGYRHCTGWQPGIILRVGMSWELDRDEAILQKVKEANRVRLSKQPLHLPSCGSVFINPPGQKAGALIDQCGLRGFQIGGAQVSEKHANFIVNTGEAKALDVHQVIGFVQKVVLEKTGTRLKTEVVYLGDWSVRLG